MSQIRNHRFAGGVLASAGGVLMYVVPAGVVVLLKNVSLFSSNAAAQEMSLAISGPDIGAQLYIAADSIPANGIYTWAGWMALNAGDTLSLFGAAGGLVYAASGAVLPYIPDTNAQVGIMAMDVRPQTGDPLPYPAPPPVGPGTNNWRPGF